MNEVEANGKVYDIGYILIDYIKSIYGSHSFIKLLRTNGNIQASLQVDTRRFEQEFYAYVKKKYLL